MNFALVALFAFVYNSLVLALLIPARGLGISTAYYLALTIIIFLVTIPFYDFLVSSYAISKSRKLNPEIFLDTIDSVLSFESINEFFDKKFTRILSILSVKKGRLIFYDKINEEYIIYVKKKNSLEQEGFLNYNNILLKVLNTPDDVLIRSKLTNAHNFEIKIRQEMERLDAEIVIPMFYSNLLMGALVFGKRSTSYTANEINALKLFGTKFAALSINSFLWKELARKKELEREKSLEKRVQKDFLPAHHFKSSSIEAELYYNTETIYSDRFIDLFEQNGSLYFTAYWTGDSNKSTLIFLPAISSLLCFYISRRYSIAESLKKTTEIIMFRELFDAPPNIFAAEFSKDNRITISRNNMPMPWLYRNSSFSRIEEDNFTLLKNEFFVFVNRYMSYYFFVHLSLIESLLPENPSAADIIDTIVNVFTRKDIDITRSMIAVFTVPAK